MKHLLLLFAFILCALSSAQAQTLVQQSASQLDVGVKCTTATAASGSAATATITPAAGNYAYITYYEVTAYASAALTGAAAANTATWSGVTGAPVHKLATKSPAAPTTDTGAIADRVYGPGAAPLKSATPGASVTLTTSSQTGMIFNVNICWVEAP